MTRELLVGFALFISNIVIHAVGSFILMSWFYREVKRPRALLPGHALWMMVLFLVILAGLHFLEIAVWAEFYLRQHCFADRDTAFYFSMTSYTTVGYGDVVLPRAWRLLGGLEPISGVLLFGWSTACLVTFLTRFRHARDESESRTGSPSH